MTVGRLGLVVVVTAIVLAPVAALGSPEDTANTIAREIMSPYCPGVTLHDCPSQEAVDMRIRIADWARSGLDRAAIEARLVEEFGPSILARPPKSGFNLIAWVLPALVAGGGIVLASWSARAWASRRATDRHNPQPTTEDRRRLRAELDRMRQAP